LDGVAVSFAELPEFIDVGLAAKEMDSEATTVKELELFGVPSTWRPL
jgi:hypothetical protein